MEVDGADPLAPPNRPPWYWLLVLGLGALGTISRYRRRYYFFDEWSMIERVHTSGSSWLPAFESYNGHLVAPTYVTYRAQMAWSGLDDHRVVYLVFVASLVLLHLAMSWLLLRGGIPALPAVLAGGLVTYFGVGSQDMVWEFQQAINEALAAALLAAVVVLSRPTSPRVALASGLLMLGVLCDSGIAAMGIVFCGLLAAPRWPWRSTLLLLVPSVSLLAWSTWAGGTGPEFPATLSRQISLAGRLLLSGTGGLVGGASAAGALVLVVAGGIALAHLVRGRLDRPAADLLVAGGVTAVVAAALIARQRAGHIGDSFTDYNRYLHLVAVWVACALLPATWSIVARRLPGRHHTTAAYVLSLGCVMAFVANLTPLRAYNTRFESYNAQVRVGVADVVAILDRDCPTGTVVDPKARPLGFLGPQISVQLLDDLRTAGLLHAAPPEVRSTAIADAVCVPA